MKFEHISTQPLLSVFVDHWGQQIMLEAFVSLAQPRSGRRMTSLQHIMGE